MADLTTSDAAAGDLSQATLDLTVDPPTVTPAPEPLPTPVYGARYYESYAGGAYEYTGDWEEFFSGLADRIVRQFRPSTVLDAGCAKGFLVHALRQRGVEAYGIDVSEFAVANALEPVRPYVRVASMADPLPRRYDLVTCIEAIEHVAPGEVRAAVDSLCGAADLVLLSSTGDGEHYGEPSHTSMRPAEDWAALFAEHGFLRDLDADVSWVTPWAMVLRREPAMSLPAVVRSYDRQVARLQRETAELRRAALAMEQELEELHERGRRDGTALREEVERLRRNEARAATAQTEALRLRDLLIVAERSLGQTRGELARLRDQLHGYDDLAAAHHAVVTSTTWTTAWKLLAPYRQVRSRMVR